MKVTLILFTFLISSLLLIFIVIEKNAQRIYAEKSEIIRLGKIQTLSAKTYRRTRKFYVPERSFSLAKREIKKILVKDPIQFEVNNSSFLVKSPLIKIVNIVNYVKEDVVLSISAHTDAEGTAKHNLSLSQKRADRLKEYFLDKTNLPLIVAIGYGEAFSLENRRIEINLKRIKQ
jgi:outer membrane protein OmpA-like peptidoglycan-associated protein